MFGPGWNEGCVGCSFKADHVDAALQHIERHDVKFVAISRAPLAEIAGFQQRMGWRFKWVSSYDNDFNHDYHVSYTNNEIAAGKVYYNYAMSDFVSEELSGNSVFYKDDASNVFHTYSTYGRGDEMLVGVHPRSDPRRQLTGVFATRSPDRPNPVGPHLVTVRKVVKNRLRVGPIEAIDGTPVIDIKPTLPYHPDF
jgi:hypothetical protein